MSGGKLYMVATPIGNLEDITLRALDTLKSVDVVLCEDTRVTKHLLDHFGIQKQTLSFHHHSSPMQYKNVLSMLERGSNLALVTDAGTPGISDPGNLLVNYIVNSLIPIEIFPIPGPCAAITALSISGFPTDKFLFLGFPPHKNKRQKFFKEVAASEQTVVFYESGHRILKCLGELKEVLAPEKQVLVCRELTKKFETVYRGTITEVAVKMANEKGEFVVIISK